MSRSADCSWCFWLRLERLWEKAIIFIFIHIILKNDDPQEPSFCHSCFFLALFQSRAIGNSRCFVCSRDIASSHIMRLHFPVEKPFGIIINQESSTALIMQGNRKNIWEIYESIWETFPGKQGASPTRSWVLAFLAYIKWTQPKPKQQWPVADYFKQHTDRQKWRNWMAPLPSLKLVEVDKPLVLFTVSLWHLLLMFI